MENRLNLKTLVPGLPLKVIDMSGNVTKGELINVGLFYITLITDSAGTQTMLLIKNIADIKEL